jgi:hypothetical protein
MAGRSAACPWDGHWVRLRIAAAIGNFGLMRKNCRAAVLFQRLPQGAGEFGARFSISIHHPPAARPRRGPKHLRCGRIFVEFLAQPVDALLGKRSILWVHLK